jgi:hypothetical protein
MYKLNSYAEPAPCDRKGAAIAASLSDPKGEKTEHGRRNKHIGEARSQWGCAGAAARSLKGADQAHN